MGASNKNDAREIWIMCSRDPLYYLNTFGWTYNPKFKVNGDLFPVIPWITWDVQDEAMIALFESILGGEDVLFKKSREMGASWDCVEAMEYLWHFRDNLSFLMVSRNEDYVDKARNPKALFWKLDFILENLPSFMKPHVNRVRLSIYNEDTGSTIDGESTTGDVARGDRRTAILMDEIAAFEVTDGYRAEASTQHATDCRIFNFTPSGTGNVAYDLAQKPELRKIVLHWSRHPDKSKGLYTSENGKVKILDTSYAFPNDYPFILDGKLRSPWYDLQCRRAAHPMTIAAELDMDFLGSTYQFFDEGVLTKLKIEYVRPPFAVGNLSFDHESLETFEFALAEKGAFNLWVTLVNGRLPSDQSFVVAADIATGTGASNSTLSIGNEKTKEKVAEYANSRIKPEDFGKLAVATAKFFNDAFMIWEANGPGRIFGNTVIEVGYRNIFYRQQNDQSLNQKTTDVPGWYSTRENKLTLLGNYRKALGGLDHPSEFVIRSERSLQEAREYIYLPNNSVEHSKSLNLIDPTGAGENHGDMTIADALLCKGLNRSTVTEKESEPDVPESSLLARRNAYMKTMVEDW
jgi:hypothetical protein